jgi:hypothetical protein
MAFSWYRDLYKIGSLTGVKDVTIRMALAVGILSSVGPVTTRPPR